MPVLVLAWIAIAIIYIGYHWKASVEFLTWWQIAIRIVLVFTLLPVILLVQFGMFIKEID